ncbi:nucleotidyltransferase [bacterium]|nr:nucleotidyltransferase [bacterium]
MDTESLLRSLNEHKVRYVVIGATAFPVHGYARATLDIDIFIEATPENAQATLVALNDFGYDVTDISLEDLLTKKILIRQYSVETDIHPFVSGVHFEDIWSHRVEDKIGETTASFASLDDLIRMKQSAARPKDQEDLRVLLKLKKLKEQHDRGQVNG